MSGVRKPYTGTCGDEPDAKAGATRTNHGAEIPLPRMPADIALSWTERFGLAYDPQKFEHAVSIPRLDDSTICGRLIGAGWWEALGIYSEARWTMPVMDGSSRRPCDGCRQRIEEQRP